ncbi:hypothetical protein SAMN04489709_10542 [Paracidovorax citrulli]|nr:hypothetical protein SAMN04489709_10542 [Paracidovorax citrulli]
MAQAGEAVTQMDQAIQQNAVLVEQSAAAASSLKAQADQLVVVVSVFRLRAWYPPEPERGKAPQPAVEVLPQRDRTLKRP